MRLLLGLSLAAFAWLSPAAAAWDTLTPVDGFASDGERWAVAGTAPGHLLVFDDRAPGWRPVQFDPVCSFGGAVGAGRAVLRCSPTGRVEVLDLRSGASTRVPSIDETSYWGGASIDFVAVGRHWLEASISAHHVEGVRRYFSLDQPVSRQVVGDRHEADLDAPDVGRKLCDPVRRPRYQEQTEGANTPAYERLQGDDGWWVMRAGFEASPRRRLATLAWRCGARRPEVIFRRKYGFQVGAGVATAVDPYEDVGVAHRLEDGARRSFRLPRGEGRVWQFRHTARHVFAVRTAPSGRLTVSTTRLRF